MEFDANVRKLPWTFRPLTAGCRRASGRGDPGGLRGREHHRPAADRSGGAELRPAARQRVFQEARMLLFYAADVRAARKTADAGRLCRRSRRCRATSARSRCRIRSSRSKATTPSSRQPRRKITRLKNEGQPMSTNPTGAGPYYFVPQPSYWPITGSCALLLMGFGAASLVQLVRLRAVAGACRVLRSADDDVRLVRPRHR